MTKYPKNVIGNKLLEIRGRKGALERVRKENLTRGNFKKVIILENEMVEIDKEYIFITKRINIIVENNEVPQSKYYYCVEGSEKLHSVCYHKVLGKCFLRYLQVTGRLVMKVDTRLDRTCGICRQFVFEGTEYTNVKGNLMHDVCLQKAWKEFKKKEEPNANAKT